MGIIEHLRELIADERNSTDVRHSAQHLLRLLSRESATEAEPPEDAGN